MTTRPPPSLLCLCGRRRLLLAALALAAASLAPAGGAWARSRPPNIAAPLTADDARAGVAQGEIKPMGEVLRQLRGELGGRQIDARLAGDRASPVYEIQWLTDDGRRIDITLDARTGAVLRRRGG